MPLEPTVASSEEGVVVVRGAASGFAQEILMGRHRLAADEPLDAGGTDTGSNPSICCLQLSGPERR